MRQPQTETQVQAGAKKGHARAKCYGDRAHVRVERRGRSGDSGTQAQTFLTVPLFSLPGMVTVADGESEFRKHRAARTARKIFEMIATEIVRRTANQMNRPLRARTRKIAQLDVIVHPNISLPVSHSAHLYVNIKNAEVSASQSVAIKRMNAHLRRIEK